MVPSLDVAADASGLRQARRFVAEVLRRWGVPEACVYDAQLLTNELVTNALIHARSSSSVSVVRDSLDSVRVEVADHNPTVPTPRDRGPEAVTGRGLMIVERLARAWGVIPDAGGGKVVWFELDVHSQEDARRRDDASGEMIG